MIKIIQYALCLVAAIGATTALGGAIWGMYSNYGADPGVLVVGGVCAAVYAGIMGIVIDVLKGIRK